jgi:hypothetical protein
MCIRPRDNALWDFLRHITSCSRVNHGASHLGAWSDHSATFDRHAEKGLGKYRSDSVFLQIAAKTGNRYWATWSSWGTDRNDPLSFYLLTCASWSYSSKSCGFRNSAHKQKRKQFGKWPSEILEINLCWGGILGMPFSGDGDNADREFTKSFFAITKSEHG